MSYIFFLFSIATYAAYFCLKYIAYRTFFSKRPTFTELQKYTFENNALRGRNAKALKYFSIFLALFGVLGMPFTPNIATELKDREFVLVMLKMLLLLVITINFLARNVLYEEELKGNKKFAMPLLEIVDVMRRTGWLVWRKDFISVVLNLSSIAMIVIFISLFYTLFNF